MLVPCLAIAFAAGSSEGQTQYRKEVRGVYLTNVDSDVLFSNEKLAAAMDYLSSAGVNVVYPVVWNKGYTLYPSEVMEREFGLTQDPFFASQQRDPLAEVVTEAHRVGMEVIPWFEYGFVALYSSDGGHIIQARPHWSAIDNAGTLLVKNGFAWMNGLHPEVQEFMLSLVREVIENNDLDGVQGDDRLPAMPIEAGYSDFTRQVYRDEHGGQDPPADFRNVAWRTWRANRLTTFAGRLYRMVKDLDPSLTVALAPSI